MHMTFRSDTNHFTANLHDMGGNDLLLLKAVADPGAEFSETYIQFGNLLNVLSRPHNPIQEVVNQVSEEDFRNNLAHFIRRFAASQDELMAEHGIQPDSPEGLEMLSNVKRQVEFVKHVLTLPNEQMRAAVRLIRIEVLRNGFMLIFGNVEQEVIAMACFVNNHFKLPSEVAVEDEGLKVLHVGTVH